MIIGAIGMDGPIAQRDRGAGALPCDAFGSRQAREHAQTPHLARALAATAIFALAWAELRSGDKFRYNRSPSLPIGLYLRTNAAPARGSVVTVRAIAVAPDRAHLRGFDDPDDRIVKRVAAQHGDLARAEGAIRHSLSQLSQLRTKRKHPDDCVLRSELASVRCRLQSSQTNIALDYFCRFFYLYVEKRLPNV